jgi:hypothetical protein
MTIDKKKDSQKDQEWRIEMQQAWKEQSAFVFGVVSEMRNDMRWLQDTIISHLIQKPKGRKKREWIKSLTKWISE